MVKVERPAARQRRPERGVSPLLEYHYRMAFGSIVLASALLVILVVERIPLSWRKALGGLILLSALVLGIAPDPP